MTKHQTRPAQTDKVARLDSDRSPVKAKEQPKARPKDDEEFPGAEGPLSAGANEDTYD